MDGGRCLICGDRGADIHTALCVQCFLAQPAYWRCKAERNAIQNALLRQALITGNDMAIRWTEKQYQEHIRKTQAPQEREERKPRGKGKQPKVPAGTLTFELPLELVPMPNGPKGLARMHYQAKRRLKEKLANVLAPQVPTASGTPFLYAKVEMIRYSSGSADKDNLYASAKFLLDVLQVNSKRHPHGIYVLENDDTEHIELSARFEKAAPGKGRVLVLITPLPDFGRK